MLLAVDASIVVGEGLRSAGRELLRHGDLQLVATATVYSESRYELPQRVAAMIQRGAVSRDRGDALLSRALDDIETIVTVYDQEFYESHLSEALRRMPRDPSDAPTVALALALGCGIWTADSDFCGCGVAVWASDVLRAHLAGGT